MPDEGQPKQQNFWKSPLAIVCYVGVGFWVYNYHLEHALGLLPYAILLLCPLMHIFMMKHHGGCHHDHGDKQNNKEKEDNNGSRN